MKKIILLFSTTFLLSTFMLATNVASSLQGNGTDADPYKIGTVDELLFFRNQVNDSVSAYMTASYELASSLDLQNETWIAIGNVGSRPFKGKFNGKGNKISNLKIGTSTAKAEVLYASFFGIIVDATITNLSVETDGIYATGVSNAGILAAIATGSIISNCNVSGILSTASSTANYIGGLVGKANGSKIVNCMANVTLTSTASGTLNIGGLVGNLSSGTFQGTASTNSYIYNSYSTTSVYSSTLSSVSYTGGLVGQMPGGHIYNSYSSATVKGECTSGSTNTYVGGIIGQGTAGLDVKNCIALNSSLICINATGNKQIGRIAGATVNTAINYDADYGLETMTVQSGTASNTLATVNLGTKLITNKQGADLGSNLPKNLLNAYVSSNTAPNGISWLNWTSIVGVNNGNPIFDNVASAVNRIDDANAMRVYSNNGVVTVVNIEAGKSIEIYSISGVLMSKKIANGNRLDVAMPKGVYIVKGIRNLVVNQ